MLQANQKDARYRHLICGGEAHGRARMARTSGTSCMIEGYSDDERKTRVHLISGSCETLMSTCRAIVGVVVHAIGQPHRIFPSELIAGILW